MQSAIVPQTSMQSPRSRIYDISTRQLKNFLSETEFPKDDVNAAIGDLEMKDIEKSAVGSLLLYHTDIYSITQI
jgi:hypothetical protein